MASTAIEEALSAARLRRQLPPPQLRRLLRERCGLSQQALAAAVGVSAAAVSRWEAGLRTPRGDDLRRYAAALARLAAEAAGGA
jgi:transcriptional regulator with XRE-family HTH domain